MFDKNDESRSKLYATQACSGPTQMKTEKCTNFKEISKFKTNWNLPSSVGDEARNGRIPHYAPFCELCTEGHEDISHLSFLL
jgi:hypothetical protein